MPHSTTHNDTMTYHDMQFLGNNLADGILCFHLAARPSIVFLNSTMKAMLGHTEDDYSSELWSDYLFEEDQVSFWNQFSDISQSTGNMDYRIITKQKYILWIRASFHRITMEDGKTVILQICKNISDLMSGQTATLSSVWQTPAFTNQVPCGIFIAIADPPYSLLYGNEFFYKIYGYSYEEALSAGFVNCKFIVDPADFPYVAAKIAREIAEHNYNFELENRGVSKGKEQIWVLVRCRYNPDGSNTLYGSIFDITARKKAEEQLRVSEEENRIAIEQSGKLILRYHVQTQTLCLPDSAISVFGTKSTYEQVPDSMIEDGIIAKESIQEYRGFYQNIISGIPTGSCVFKMRLADKKTYDWFKSDYTLLYDDMRQPIRAIISMENITALHDKEIAYTRWQQAFAPQKKGCVAYYEYNLSNDVFETVEGPAEQIAMNYAHESFFALTSYAADHFVIPEDRDLYLNVLKREYLLDQFIKGNQEIILEHRRYDSEGKPFWAAVEIQMILDPFMNIIKAFLLVKNINEQKKESLELKLKSQTDPLTGLLNRSTLETIIENILAADKSTNRHAFVMLDIDHFKLLNDSRGHQFGDQILKDVAVGLKASIGPDDYCGRLGGDEFIIFYHDISDQEQFLYRFEELRKSISKKYSHDFLLSGSFGIAYSPEHGTDFRSLYQKADIALYKAKTQGRDQFVIYKEE